MQTDSPESGPGGAAPAGSGLPPADHGAALRPQFSRKLAWVAGTCAMLALAAVTVWAVRAWQTEQALANVGASVTAGTVAAPRAAAPDGAMAQRGTATAAASGQAQGEQPQGAQAEGELMRDTVAAPAGTDRLPPLVLSGQPVPQAVLRDLPDWVATGLEPAQTSGGSGDETAEPAKPPPVPRGAGSTAPRRPDGYGAVFARCPGPGESGAVECRRAVCDGAARKSAACAPYLR